MGILQQKKKKKAQKTKRLAKDENESKRRRNVIVINVSSDEMFANKQNSPPTNRNVKWIVDVRQWVSIRHVEKFTFDWVFFPSGWYIIHCEKREAKRVAAAAAAGSSKGDNETARKAQSVERLKKRGGEGVQRGGKGTCNWTIGGRIHLKQLNLWDCWFCAFAKLCRPMKAEQLRQKGKKGCAPQPSFLSSPYSFWFYFVFAAHVFVYISTLR